MSLLVSERGMLIVDVSPAVCSIVGGVENVMG